MPPRPALPEKHANQRIKHLDAASLPPVKYQILTCQGQDILVGRMKIATPTASGHAFILRRFDTGAISLTTMFRAAFPEASEQEEKRETMYVKDNFDLSGNNGSYKENTIVRLAGTWVSPTVALTLSEAYHLGHIIRIIAEAKPDPNATYRRSGKSGNTPKDSPVKDGPSTPPAMSRTLPTPSPSTAPSATKRRKESSPGPVHAKEPEPETASSAPARRSTRMKSKSPAPSSVFSPLSPSGKKPGRPAKTVKATKTASRKVAPVAPIGSDETVVDEDIEAAETMAHELHKEDMTAQRELLSNLQAQSQRHTAMEITDAGAKRARDDESEYPRHLNFKEPEVGERAIATNKRVGRFQLGPKQKSFAWGVAAFAVGLGAVAYLPNLL